MNNRFSWIFVAVVMAALCVGCGDDEAPADAIDAAETADDDAANADSVVGDDSLVRDSLEGDVADMDTAGDSLVPTDLADAREDDAVDALDPDTADIPTVDVPVVIPEEVEAINAALDEDFLVPNRGLALKMVAPLLGGYPESGLTAAERPWIMHAELLLPSGETVDMSVIDNAFATLYPIDGYGDSWVFINAGSLYEEPNPVYTLNLYPTLSTLQWMKEAGVEEISGDYASFVIYKSAWFNGSWVTCPAMASTAGSQSAMRVHFDVDTLETGVPLGLMLNSHVTDDRAELVSMYQAGSYQELCECYDVVGESYSARECTADDIDWFPGQAQAVFPKDGAEGVALSEGDGAGQVTLEWTSAGDPDGGGVEYDLYLGTDESDIPFVMFQMSQTSFSLSLEPDTQYFWRVDVRDDEGNKVRGQVWTFNTDTEVPVLEPHNYLVIVDKRLQGQIEDELDRYVEDIKTMYDLYPAVRYWMPGDHVMMRDMIVDSFTNKCYGKAGCLRGVFLIGDLPSAWYEQDSDFGGDIGIMHEEFPTELYFQDLDCEWTDSDGDGMFDGHGDLNLEIFTSRLIGDADRINAYLARVHDYRVNGPFFEPRNFFSFVDDDWNGANAYGVPDGGTTNQTWGLESIFGENYIRREWEDNTDKSDYMDVMTTGGAEFVYQWIHSDPQRIYFDDNFSVNPDNILTLEEIAAGGIDGSFFNLFDCSISRYTEEYGNIATEYVHSDKGLATIGSTKTGGIFNPDVLHGAMLAGQGVGEALRLWFNDTWLNRDEYGLPDPTFDDWWLGMMVQGDPMLLLNPNPPVTVQRRGAQDAGPAARRTFTPEQLRSLYLMMGRRAAVTKVGSYADWLGSR